MAYQISHFGASKIIFSGGPQTKTTFTKWSSSLKKAENRCSGVPNWSICIIRAMLSISSRTLCLKTALKRNYAYAQEVECHRRTMRDSMGKTRDGLEKKLTGNHRRPQEENFKLMARGLTRVPKTKLLTVSIF